MNKLPLKVLPSSKFSQNASLSKASQLDSSMSVKDVCNALCTKQEASKGLIVQISGHPGSGKSVFAQAIFQELLYDGCVKESEVLYLEIGPYDGVTSLWNTGIEIAKENGDRGVLELLASGTATQDAKVKAVAQLLDNFNTICFDHLSSKNEELYTLLLSLVKILTNNIICIFTNLTNFSVIKDTEMNVTINGLCNEATLNMTKTVMDVNLFECGHNLSNPKALQIYVKSYLEFGANKLTQTANEKASVCNVLEMIWGHLCDEEKCVLLQLSELRQPLPIKGNDHTLIRLIRMGLVKHETLISQGCACDFVSLSNSVQDFVHDKSLVASPPAAEVKFSVLDCWMSLLSHELLGLVSDARKNMWPFIPEKWQYVSYAGEKESYNVKDLLTLRTKDASYLTQFDILQECLHHSIERKDYANMAAIIFVLDRFIYWQGGSKMLLCIVDSIARGDPNLPIAPQLVIRKARILRTSGDLQGAEKVLDMLLSEKEKLGVWRYKEKHDHHLVRAVCIQIKGEIQASLGQWLTAATHLLDSVQLFKTLPKVDKKGLSCSLGLLVNTLQNMSTEEYKEIAVKYSLVSPHPFLQAYDFAHEAAQLSVFTPLFLARSKRRAGEMMLQYSRLYANHVHQSRYLKDALSRLKESLEAHKSIESLTSREQLYEFISATYKASCVLELQPDGNKTGWDLRRLSMLLYDHYCRHSTYVVHDDFSEQLINQALLLLGLPTFSAKSSHAALPENAVYSVPIIPQGAQKLLDRESMQATTALTVDKCAETLQTVTLTAGPATVDRSRSTVLTLDGTDCGVDDEQRSGTNQINPVDTLNNVLQGATSVHECETSRYDPVYSKWRTQKTLVYIGEQLNLAKGKQGAQRDPFMVESLNQDEPLGKYVGKKYKKSLDAQQYEEDVRCQMTARYYVGLFNEDLYRKGIEVSPIQFLPVVLVRLLDDAGERTSSIYNVEPYIHGDFTKLTNNWSFVDKEGEGSKLVLAFSHFTYEKSKQTMLIVDHQGWTSSDHLSTTFLTDPQIHSLDKKHFGTGNLGIRGIAKFWESVHTECNNICRQLGLQRPATSAWRSG